MGMTAAEYRNQLVQLLPKGKAWEILPGNVMDNLLNGVAIELARTDGRGDDLLDEADPRTTYELLEDWERVFGLPDDCTGPEDSLESRRQQIVSKMVMRGNQSIQFFKDLAAALGYTIEIEEFTPFRVGDRVGARCYGLEWVHAFSVISSLGTIREFRAGQNYVGERLREFGNDVLECIINRAKPSHSVAIFEYD
jgi:uncharacterized protein YmfQ (DUF2313 family)